MAEKNNANIGFEEQLWKAACVLWGHIPAAEYRKVIVGLIFLRYISSVFDKKYQELVAEGDGFENDKDEYLSENIFYVPEEARWNKISEAAHTPEIGKIIDDAMLAIERENKTLKGVLPKNYGSPDLDKRVLGDVVDLFTNNIKMDDTEESKDLLGRTYEYCIAQFAEKEGAGGNQCAAAAGRKRGKGGIQPFPGQCGSFGSVERSGNPEGDRSVYREEGHAGGFVRHYRGYQ